jgi:hypothetical protein
MCLWALMGLKDYIFKKSVYRFFRNFSGYSEMAVGHPWEQRFVVCTLGGTVSLGRET